jgi:peroxiredoxin
MKKNTIHLSLCLFFLFTISFAHSQGLNIGDKAVDFNLKNIDGKMISLSGIQNNKGAIIVFTCNNCPFSIAYEDRIIALHQKYAAAGYPGVAINPNDADRVPEDSYRNMKKRAKEKKFPYVYLHDETQEVAKSYGATRTPHVFILQKDSDGVYVVKYIGAIDNNTDDPVAADKKYIESALNELNSGAPISTPITKAIGCSIKWKQK